MKGKKMVSTIVLTFSAIASVMMVKPADAQEQTLAICNTSSTSIRTYRMNDRTMMRLFNRQNSIVMLDAQAQRNLNPEGITYTARAETTYTLFVPTDPNGRCSLQTSNFSPEFGSIGANESSVSSTVALCQTSRNAIRIYRMNDQLMMRAFDRQTNGVWLNAVANQEAGPTGTTYSNVRGERLLQLYVPKSSNDRSCSFQVNHGQAEFGTVIEKS